MLGDSQSQCVRAFGGFHKSAKLKQFMQQMLGPRQDRVLRFDSAAASQLALDHFQQASVHCGVVVNSNKGRKVRNFNLSYLINTPM